MLLSASSNVDRLDSERIEKLNKLQSKMLPFHPLFLRFPSTFQLPQDAFLNPFQPRHWDQPQKCGFSFPHFRLPDVVPGCSESEQRPKYTPGTVETNLTSINKVDRDLLLYHFFRSYMPGYFPHFFFHPRHADVINDNISNISSNNNNKAHSEAFNQQYTTHFNMNSYRTPRKPFLELEGRNLWREFHSHGTEMVITKNGRRMFPLPSFRVFGMEPGENYHILMDIVPVDQFRYKFQGASWTVAGRADPEPHQKAFVHPDSPCAGSLWMAKSVSFNRLKLSNHAAEKQGYLVLNSMQKYQPRVHVIKSSDHPSSPPNVDTFVFEEMQFMAVTAYQNEKVTQLKIENNPFAKGFRISSDTGKAAKKRPRSSWRHKTIKRWFHHQTNPATIPHHFAETRTIMAVKPWPIGSENRDGQRKERDVGTTSDVDESNRDEDDLEEYMSSPSDCESDVIVE